MKRIFLAITICFLTTAMVAQGILAYQLSATQTLIAEEESHDETPQKNFKKDIKETYFLNHSLISGTSRKKKSLHFTPERFSYSKGYVEKPFTPPDHS